ncbi:MAG: polyprenyl synthetase family protein [Armatimonadetes bacterium]|nr:polyprenyl synthetase family protein [Armatimonadota bacterium]
MITEKKARERAVPLPFQFVREELRQLDELLLRESQSAVGMVSEISRHILSAGGKRLRPALLLTSARAVGYEGAWGLKLAACMELLHTATLVHDDVVDHSDWRRGRVAAHERWGYSASVLSGDVMFARAMRILVDYGDLAVLDAVTSTIIQVCEGEVQELAVDGDLDLAAETYLQIIDAKTASLISVCCRIGGMLGGAAPEVIAALGDFGTRLGRAFQIMDDVMDLTADERRWGKPLAQDLQEGRATLPLIYSLHRADLAGRERLLRLLRQPRMGAEEIGEAIEMLDSYGGLAAARADASEEAGAAAARLSALAPSPARDALRALAHYAVSRDC